MLRIANLKAPPDADLQSLKVLCARRLKIDEKYIQSITPVKKSIDARDKGDVHIVYTIDVQVPEENRLLRRLKRDTATLAPKKAVPPRQGHRFDNPPIVVGAGPAGLFAAYWLAVNGAPPILLERGRDVDARTRDVESFFEGHALQKDSNVLFGEGGAGAFSDGKLTTGTKDPYQQFVLDTFVACGAPDEILYLSKPHIGTDKLKPVVKALREKITALGGTVHFETRLTDIHTKSNAIEAITCQKGHEKLALPCSALVLAIGHSARDTYQQLFNQGVNMVQKPFAMGLRIEHLQERINEAQYGAFSKNAHLGAADYKLNTPTPDGRGAYTFCMCPGGMVVAAASQEGGVCTNGMSYHARDGLNANSAILVGVNPADFMDDHPLAGLVFQRSLEQRAFLLGGGGFKAPCQRVEDFLHNQKTTALGDVLPTYRPGITLCNLADCLPEYITRNLQIGIAQMDKRLHGFAAPDALLTGVETRSSSPVRIVRGQTGECNIGGIFPSGEGAGYAGGIMSAAVDGIHSAARAMERSLVL